jgi:hypothetical protein
MVWIAMSSRAGEATLLCNDAEVVQITVAEHVHLASKKSKFIYFWNLFIRT